MVNFRRPVEKAYRKAVDQMENFLKSVDLTVDQVPSKAKKG
jgi:uncharacterized protein YktA (UPF0223 family)